MEEVPALVEPHLEPPEALLLLRGDTLPRLFLEQLVLLVSELVDPVDHVLIFHAVLLSTVPQPS
jgi:hypothetical protein